MYSSVLSTAISGVEGVAVLVEADVSNGLPMFSMVGFLSSRVRGGCSTHMPQPACLLS